MAELDAIPHVRALLTELLQLEDEDAQLPLAVLGNLYRTQLRAPLMAVAYLGGAYAKPNAYAVAVEILDTRWPALAYGNIYRAAHATAEVKCVAVVDQPSFYMKHIMRASLENNAVILDMIIEQAGWNSGTRVLWHSYSAPWLLYELTLPHGGVAIAAARLETILALHPEVARSLLQLATMSRANAEALTLARAHHLADQEQLAAQLQRVLALLSPRTAVRHLRGRARRARQL